MLIDQGSAAAGKTTAENTVQTGATMTNALSVLIVDDDRELAQMLTEYLTAEGFSPSVAHDGNTALTRLTAYKYDLVILDVMLPSLNGFDVLRNLRQTLSVPVIMLTAHGTDVDRIVVRYDSAFALMQDLRRMGATNILVERRRMPTRRVTMLRMAQIYGERFADSDGRIRATFDVIWLSGWAPHESQQKPLQPGSAKAGLAEAVRGTVKRE